MQAQLRQKRTAKIVALRAQAQEKARINAEKLAAQQPMRAKRIAQRAGTQSKQKSKPTPVAESFKQLMVCGGPFASFHDPILALEIDVMHITAHDIGYAIINNNTALLPMLDAYIKNGGDVNATFDNDNQNHQWTLLHYAVQQRNKAVVSALLNAGALANVQDAQGVTPLMLAVSTCQPAVVEDLINHQANPRMTNKTGQTAYDLATIKKATVCQIPELKSSAQTDAFNKIMETLQKYQQ